MTRRPLSKIQRKTMRFIRQRHGCAGVFLAPGVGKTLCVIRYVASRGNPLSLVICRPDDIKTWCDELIQEGYNLDEDVHIIRSGKDAKREFPTGIALKQWTIVTYDLLKSEQVHAIISAINYDTVAADELHMIKRASTKRTKRVISATRHISHRLGLTGSHITNEPLDVFSQCLFIDNGATFGQSEWAFKKRYYIKSGYGWYRKKDARDRIGAKLKDLAIHVHEDDVLELPPKRRVVKTAPMTRDQRKFYKQIIDEWEYELESGTVELSHVVTRLTKLKQVASGFLYDENKNPVYFDSGKMKLWTELVSSPDYLLDQSRIVTFCAFRAEISRLAAECRKLGVKPIVFHGGVSQKAKIAARNEFGEESQVRKMFICQVDSAVGMNELVTAKHGIYYSNSDKIVSRQQSERRIRRRGSEGHDSITYWDLVTKDSVDEGQLRSIRQKMSFAQSVLEHIREGSSLKKSLT